MANSERRQPPSPDSRRKETGELSIIILGASPRLLTNAGITMNKDKVSLTIEEARLLRDYLLKMLPMMQEALKVSLNYEYVEDTREGAKQPRQAGSVLKDSSEALELLKVIYTHYPSLISITK